MYYFNPRSPWGSDALWVEYLLSPDYFNPRSPWGSDPDHQRFQHRHPISIHAPRGGATWRRPDQLIHLPISIHAPRGGATLGKGRSRYYLRDFNPRSPWGERPTTAAVLLPSSIFQSTLPVGGATLIFPDSFIAGNNFNPRSPCGERPSDRVYCPGWSKISIHAPRGGSDTPNKE